MFLICQLRVATLTGFGAGPEVLPHRQTKKLPSNRPILLSFYNLETQHQMFKVFLKGEFEGETFLFTKSDPLKVFIFEKLNSIV